MFTYSTFNQDYNRSQYKYTEYIEVRSREYAVTVNGQDVPVYTCRISQCPFNRAWPGFQRSGEQSELASFVNLVSDEPLDITVHVKIPYERAILKPYSKGIAFTETNGDVSFRLDDNGNFVFEADNYHHTLYIFNSPLIPCPDPAAVTHYFGPGIHYPGKITLRSNESVYVDKDALVFGCVYAEDAVNLHIYGNGLFDDSCEGRISYECYEANTNGNLKFYNCKNIRVEGILCRDSAIWCTNYFHCTDVVIDGTKIFGQWHYNTDGIDIVNSQNVIIKNSFIHSFDDTIVIKGIKRFCDMDNVNILVENCILWCDWGKTCEIGIETYCRRYQNITFRNCDILRAGSWAAICVDNGEVAEMSDMLFEDIRVEYNSFDTWPVIQDGAHSVYDLWDKVAIPTLFTAVNMHWNNEEKIDVDLDLTGIEPRTIHDITCRNLRVYYDEGVPMTPDGKYDIRILVKSYVEGVRFRNIALSDIFVNGVKMNPEDLSLAISDTDNFVIE